MIDFQTAIKIHAFVLESTGGFKTKGFSESLLDSALNAPFQSVFGQDMFKTIEAKAARLAFGIIKNHPFKDGNKCTGLMLMLCLLESNGIKLKFSNDDLIALGLGIADGSLKQNEIEKWGETHKG